LDFAYRVTTCFGSSPRSGRFGAKEHDCQVDFLLTMVKSTLQMNGNHILKGTIHVSGSKNASLPILAATFLSAGEHVLENVPSLLDITEMCSIMGHLGAKVYHLNSRLHVQTSGIRLEEIPKCLARTLRGSILFLGPLLARFGYVKLPFPGGCAIGTRPIDQHLKGLRALGAEVSWDGENIEAKAPTGLRSGEVRFDVPTVTGTANILMAAASIEGTTFIFNAAREPEIVDLISVLSKMGAVVKGAGTGCIRVRGKVSLSPVSHRIMTDRIECGTYMVAGALAGQPLRIVGGVVAHQAMLTRKLKELGATIFADGSTIVVYRTTNPRAISIETAAFPGIPTDIQAQLMTLLATVPGVSTITENIFENRFGHAVELNRMGAQIHVDGRKAVITGVLTLVGTAVKASDLRSGAALVLAGICARGHTTVENISLIDRGYESIEKKLADVGANIWRESADLGGTAGFAARKENIL
jgi:UDP-N-acetylglucosamine 1-carboxyvinyltransferase